LREPITVSRTTFPDSIPRYPFVDDSEPSTSAQPPKPRPDPVALAGDPSLNPDADLLVGHVSIVTAHAFTKDKRRLITVDRDEHVRVNRYPETYVIDKFIWGHKEYVRSSFGMRLCSDIPQLCFDPRTLGNR
jgi:hypothetical protein